MRTLSIALSDAPRRHVLSDGGTTVTILSRGCITQDWRIATDGGEIPVVLGYSDAMKYAQDPYFMGAVVGRCAGRTVQAGFDLNGERWTLDANEAPHHLHGGRGGIWAQDWQSDSDGTRAVQLRLTSLHGDQGYPGRVDFCVTITLNGDELSYDMRAISDRPTPLSLAQHSYYNLMGGGLIHNHRLGLRSKYALPQTEDLIVRGTQVPVEGTPLDLNAVAVLGDCDPMGQGLDLAYVLAAPDIRLAAPNGVILQARTNQPCAQLYTGCHLGAPFAPFQGVCLEPQGFPDAVNQAAFPTALTTPDHPYHQTLSVRIAQDRP
ncbi:MAG: aldose epimerase family protein [Sedimentitalea sp.]